MRRGRRPAAAHHAARPVAAARPACSSPTFSTPSRRRTSGTRIVDLVGGNPLYAEQYVRLLLDGGFLVRAGDGLHLATDAELPLPETVQAVLAARLDTLPPEHKALLCDAAVIGETFWRGGVAALSGREAGAVDEAMAALAARDLVRPVVDAVDGGRAGVPLLARPGSRRGLRAAAAQGCGRASTRPPRCGSSGRPASARDEFAEILAHHYVTALDLARATGDEELADSLVAPTIGALARAGERALRLDVAAAERHFARALELAGPDTQREAEAPPALGEALLLAQPLSGGGRRLRGGHRGPQSVGRDPSRGGRDVLACQRAHPLGEPSVDLIARRPSTCWRTTVPRPSRPRCSGTTL